MTTARSKLIDLNATPYYHCITRCVRRTFLLGKDSQTGRDYSHRKGWIVDRIKQLSSIFAIKICAYAVMTNHYHLVLFVNEIQAKQWGNEDILSRWEAIFPTDAKNLRKSKLPPNLIRERIDLIRQRLASISWFMRCLNEIIAKKSNNEEKLSGRFWEGRFKSQALLDEGAVLAAMVYVDLNPIRAKTAKTPEDSEFTSIYERIKALKKEVKINTKKGSSKFSNSCQSTNLMLISTLPNSSLTKIDFNILDYLELVDYTGRIIREDKKGTISNKLNSILSRLQLNPNKWLSMTSNLENKFYDAIGNPKKMIEFKNGLKTTPRGLNASKQYYQACMA